ncbi:MAG: hypothetical protein K2W95_11095 [Candidatus Obscuribacterales bacterium]|nr:hypothetical protein [Candidatus Obscuribacterales bacterium]
MRLMHPMGPTFIVLESLAIAFAVIAIIAVAVAVTVYAFFWAIECFAYWGRRNRQSLNELRTIIHEQAQAPATPSQNRRNDSETGFERVGVARPVCSVVSEWLSFHEIELFVKNPCTNSGWLRWLRKAEANGNVLLVAVIHNNLGVKLARKGDLVTACEHFRCAAAAFERIPHDITAGQSTIACLEALTGLGHTESAARLAEVRALMDSQYLRFTIADMVIRNHMAALIRKDAPEGVHCYLKGAELLRRNQKQEAVAMFERAGDDFQANLSGQWYRWPIAAARNDQVVASLFVDGYGIEEAAMLYGAFKVAEGSEVPGDGLRVILRQNVQLGGMKVA